MPTFTSQISFVRDVPDSRDHIISLAPEHLLKPLPPHVDLRPHCSRVLDQGALPTCTAHAVAGAFSYELRRQKLREFTPSRLFIYFNERALTHQRSLHCVVSLRDGLKAVSKLGVCPESHWPYKKSDEFVKQRPPDEAFEAAASHKLLEYHRVPIESLKPKVFLKHLKTLLADGRPVLFGFQAHKSFITPPTGKWKSSIMPLPGKKHDPLKFGHAVMAVGYDDRNKTALVRNSWGTPWGIKGYFHMPYALICDHKIAHDFWTVRGVTG